MSGWQVLAVAVGVSLLATLVIGIAMWLWPVRLPQGRSVVEIEQRVRRERTDMDTAVWPMGFPHDAPEHAMSVVEAQMTMQRHRACRVGECPRKTAAWRALVEAGRIRPDAGRQR
ncbi:hypothetical protein OHA40_06880 [Nocardia sp. NBC_00508]|uniref:hypothetical protein n=1 Tax=Nocardia sp. NBC_00508 TaxID=2975992 RepID=UPI002E819FF6|nr:hypothetical protein [Nocardia sp. NBC_00508]WUD67845.1 hypothetical protein OHA40_06880 [Nocardia sp. NBC_00508]